jgi:hypothetical protein
LLRGHAADDVRAALGRISRALVALPSRSVRDPSLASGSAGLALAHAALAPMFPRAGHLAHSEAALDRAIDALARTTLSPSLYSGFAGVAWAVELLRGDSGEDANEAIDEVLLRYLARTPWTRPYELISGLAGLGVYALERLPRAGARRILELIVERLAETARRRRPGLAWASDPEWLPEEYRTDPHVTWNLGVAHGVPGVVVVLAGACASGVAMPEARRLLDGAVGWLLAQELPRRADACFPYGVGRRVPRTPARSAWCYGDPGVAGVLLAAACAVGEPTWKREAVRIALRAAARPPGACGVVDAGLCHGAAGLGHVFHRMHRATGEPRLARAARFWLARALAMRRRTGAIAGFAAWEPDAPGRFGWRPTAGFLTGVAGIALALTAALTSEEPAWDRVLLLSLRVPREERRGGTPRRMVRA